MRSTLVLLGVLIIHTLSFAQSPQDKYPLISCEDENLHYLLVEANKKALNKEGKLTMFQIFQAPSKTFIPVYLPVEKGKVYEINFATDEKQKSLEFVLRDYENNTLLEEKNKNKDKNYAVHTRQFRARESGYLILLVKQKTTKNQSYCLGLSLIEKK